MTSQPVDYAALAEQARQQSAPKVDYAALAEQARQGGSAPKTDPTKGTAYEGYARMGEGVKDALTGLVHLPGSAYHALTDPASSPEELASVQHGGGISLAINRMIGKPMLAEQKKADETTGVESLGHRVAGSIPGIGPFAGAAGEAIGKDPLRGGAELLTNLAIPKAAGAALDAAKVIPKALDSARGALAEKAVAPLVRKPLGATLEDAKFGRDPVKAITDEGLAGTKEQVLEQAKSRVGQISDAVDQTLKNHPNSGVQIDAAPIIDSAIDNAVSSAKKTGNKAVVTRLENLREALKTEYGPTKGTPYEINQLKREVGQIGSDLGAFKSTDPLEASAAGAMADVYSGLKKAVNEQVPEIAPLNERISNLISAQTALKRNLALQENSSLLDSHTLFSAGAKAVKNTVASAPVRTFASRILNAGNALAEPEAVPQQTGAAATAKARFQAARAAAESKSNAVPVDDLSSQGKAIDVGKIKSAFSFDDIQKSSEQGGHAGNGVSSVEEISRPGTNYVVSKGGQLTYHGKTFAPESTPAGSSHVTILPDGTIRVNGGPELTPAQIFAIRRSIPSQARAAKAGDD